MILFLVPVTKIPFGDYYFTCVESYLRNPFEKGSKLDVAAQHILYHGIELHVSFYEDFEHAVEGVELFEITVSKEAKIAAHHNEAFGPAYVYTKGLTMEQIATLLDIMPVKAPHCVLAIKMPQPGQPWDTVNPYCLNELE